MSYQSFWAAATNDQKNLHRYLQVCKLLAAKFGRLVVMTTCRWFIGSLNGFLHSFLKDYGVKEIEKYYGFEKSGRHFLNVRETNKK